MFDAPHAPARQGLDQALDRAARAIPPAWPLDATVAVNPFLGQAGEDLAAASARLGRVAGVALTLPRGAFVARIDAGAISEADLAGALAASSEPARPANLAALKAAAREPAPAVPPLPTLADLAAAASGVDWPGVIDDRIGAWAAGHFDAGQAMWASGGGGAWRAWRAFASRDLTPEIHGLAGFAAHVSAAPEDAREAVRRAIGRIGPPEAALETYLHRLLATLGGWAQYARLQAWRAEQAGGADDAMTQMLAIRLAWEEALFAAHGEAMASGWAAALEAYAAPVRATPDQAVDAILQAAFERSVQRELAAVLAAPREAPAVGARPRLQAAFCIDVRSEVFRRALEATDPGVRTLGFAGFFGLGLSHRRFASDVDEARLPVLLRPALATRAAAPVAADADARIKARASRAWGRFKLAAVSSFAFVEAAGLLSAAVLVADALGLGAPPAPNDPAPRLDPGLDPSAGVAAAESILRAMSLTTGFARLVLLCGHGARVVNNPHASALHCGACGGHSGEVNARLLASLLNDPTVRAGLAARGVVIPDDTLFVGGLHDTTADAVTLYADDHPSSGHAEDLAAARAWLLAAGRAARTERAARLPGAAGEAGVRRRGRDWAQPRPEWGLAGCRAFVAAPRAVTAGLNLRGQVFLHDYDRRADPDDTVLTLILTAPVVVAGWISLQYYGSAVAPALFGGGDKLLHNVVGGMGVIEGAGGAPRTGIPWQSLHDGHRLAHEPLRLTVCVAAAPEAIGRILERHGDVRALFDNGWLHLFALDDAGAMAWRYTGDLSWTAEPAHGREGDPPRSRTAPGR